MDKFTKEAICFTLDLLTNDKYKQAREEYAEELKTELELDDWNEWCGNANTLIEVCKAIYRVHLNDEG